MALTDYINSAIDTVYSVAYADEGEEDKEPEQEEQEEKEEGGEEEEEEEEEEDEPEDIYPAIREECENSSHIAHLKHHFEHCNEKVEAGEGFQGETCAEEIHSFLHAVDDCSAPKLFTKLV
ncbi:Non-heme 11 kDa protein of cytochrome bc1 complex [Wallemia mellicola CBS 633.66]|uniref:Non-heme 11 kDa protein of cytochrome bc1 complex n=1 Tax=Wallemia mellicola (strain ATCC MYA-4683 / CBS 633.66) TaxID=671144 RepID=I4Y9E1_WALMC|nr:Non-heme 11 kDa protein of cytochrome bc1 complex [Wallemia mellicola CBS 633.66]EIM20583.1 Non-heme 11 kDa protein of cytochrome bc1 complex [Wallemia mellicola CBS 633.66]|eukprot:XP_006959373.1 Non-heme 11 kDa protein of cytochrome bc1 complex [Wallemia mellicola CBS 633.66]